MSKSKKHASACRSEFFCYRNTGVKLDVLLEDETVWLTQQQMSELFQTSRTNVVEHIKHIYEEGELEENSTCRKFRQVREEGNRTVSRMIPYYNLDMIISLGYRIRLLLPDSVYWLAPEAIDVHTLHFIKGG